MLWFTKFKNSYESDELNLNEESNRQLLLNIIIKSADIGHGAKALHLHKKFSRLIIEEFYNQGEMEAHHGLPVSKLCDRKEAVASSQKGFLGFLVVPMYEYLGKFLDSERFGENVISNLKANVSYWEEQIPVEEKNGVSDFMVETNGMFEQWRKKENKNLSPIITKYNIGKNSVLISQFPVKKLKNVNSLSERCIPVSSKNDSIVEEK